MVKSWISISLAALSPLPADEYLWLLKNISWLTFPLWPLALWGIYAWRDQIRQAPLIIPLSFSVVALCSVIFTGTELYSTLLFLVPSLSVLAALGVVSLKRSRENFLDLYSGIIYTLAVIAVWVYSLPGHKVFRPRWLSLLLVWRRMLSRTELPSPFPACRYRHPPVDRNCLLAPVQAPGFFLERRLDGRNRADCGLDYCHELIRQFD